MYQPKRPAAGLVKQEIIRRITLLLEYAFVRSNGRPTKFAIKYGIDNPKDFIAFFKLVKTNFKRDRESIALEMIVDMAESVIGRMTGRNPTPVQYFKAFVWILRTVGMVLDDLKRLRTAIKLLESRLESKYKIKVKQKLK